MNRVTLPILFISLIGFFNLFGVNQQVGIQQLIYYIVGFIAYFLVKKINRRFFFDNSKFFYWLLILILVITFIIGYEAKGSTRWINFYFFKFQPSEFLKIFFIIYLASFFTKLEKKIVSLKDFLQALIYFLIPFLLIFKQPDLGNALVYGFVFLVMFLFSPLPKKYLIQLFLILLILSPIIWKTLKPYQQARLISFINPAQSEHLASYHMIQSMITVGSGKFLGRGLGFGTQTKLLFLPESTTDFAFASLVEQFGFIFGLIVIVLYFILIYQILKKALVKNNSSEHDKEIFYYRIGFSSYLFFQILVNIGMAIGLLPIAGITLPLISYGGSSILTIMFGLALL